MMDASSIEMTVEEAAIVLRETGQITPTAPAVMLWGSPGLGKTKIIQREAEAAGAKLLVQNLSQCEPTELLGVPFKEGKLAVYAVPYFWWNCSTEAEDQSPTWIFFDDIVTASEQLQACLYSWVLERRNDLIELRDNVRFVFAGNRVEDMSAANVMPKALANRIIHVNIRCDTDLWLKWAGANGIHPWITGYIRAHPDQLNTFNPQTADSSEPALATPRTYELLSKCLTQFEKSGLLKNAIDGIAGKVTAGTVGRGVAAQFLAWSDHFHRCKTPEEICANPTGIEIPSTRDLDILYATAASLEHYLVQHPKQWSPVVKYALRINPDVGIVLISGAMRVVREKLSKEEQLKAKISKEMSDVFERFGDYISLL